MSSLIALTDSQYLKSDAPNIEGNKVEFVPFNIKTGTGIGYKNFMSSLQLTYVSAQFTEASNSKIDTNDNTYIFEKSFIMCIFSASYKWKSWKLEGCN
jgi:Fe(3+) dicitrate transport protein